MRILVIGSGGREHAICWKFSKSNKVDKIFCAPGNAGTALVAENVSIGAQELDKLADFAQENKIDLTFVGPDNSLVDGVVDVFQRRGLRIFGPSKAAARLEGSKSFAKEIMTIAKVPTARYVKLSSPTEIDDAVAKFEKAAVKADGLALGKGVIICQNQEEVREALESMLGSSSPFGNASKDVVVEELLEGEEASLLAFCDGKTAKLMLPSQDHKRILDGDKGPNTGGMGAYAPAPIVAGLEGQIHELVFAPVLKEMAKRKTPYVGILYAGLMVKDSNFNVLEFNSRFGDPETQPLLSLLESDLVDISDACIDGKLSETEIKWSKGAACCVVIASKGYPGKYETGKVISGLDSTKCMENVVVFHAGTKNEDGKFKTSGGRVLGVTATGANVKEAIEQAYLGVSKIKFEGMQYRKDIGKSALAKL